MIKTLKNLFKQDKEKFVVPKSVQSVIPIKTIWEDGVFLVGKNKYAKLNYPVMQTKNNPNFYLKRNFEKEYSDLGVPYIQENCDILNSDNLIIYGHHIKGGKMFGALESYKSKSFYEKHKTIQFDTLTEQAEYEIVAVFKTVAYSAEGYRYYDFVNAETEEAFAEYVAKCKELALYDTGVSAEYGDKLITLSTCEYSAQNGRLVVVAKKVV